jgi:hypothetical protein
MQLAGEYLKKFSNFLNNKQQSQKVVAAEIGRVLGIEIKKQKIEIKEGVVYIKESPIIKNTIFFNKKVILDNLQKGGLKVTDIR